jgi:hypothetical protein
MRNGIVAQAARNNALWCGKVCAAYGRPGEFHETLWLNRHGVPRYYPNAVTLTGSGSAALQTEAIAALIQSPRQSEWTVKDSFACLDLDRHGFLPLFDAEWLRMEAPIGDVRPETGNLQWRRVAGAADLIGWEREWAAADPNAGKTRLFMPGLLSEPDILFVFLLVNGSPAGGGILNRGVGIVGLSNLFIRSIDAEAAWRGLARAAATAFPGLALVGYDRGEELAAAHRAGFATIGPLRIWRRPPATPG